MSPHVVIHWIGIRKDSGRGSVWGWFTETGKRVVPLSIYDDLPTPHCYAFWGSIGKKLHIEEFDLTHEFLQTAETKKKNFRQADATKVTSRWGKNFEEEFSMYLLLLKMKR